jgi:hypothetical protein
VRRPSSNTPSEAQGKLGNLVARRTVEICELTAGGGGQRDDWCAAGKKHVECLAEILREGYVLKPWKGGRAERKWPAALPEVDSILRHAIFRNGGNNLNFFPSERRTSTTP